LGFRENLDSSTPRAQKRALTIAGCHTATRVAGSALRLEMFRAMATRSTPVSFLRPRAFRSSPRRVLSLRFRFTDTEERCVSGGHVHDRRREVKGRAVGWVSSRAHARNLCVRAGTGDGETAVGASDGGVTAAREAQTNRYHRFYVDELLPSGGGVVTLGRDETRHALRALRLKPGDLLEVCDGKGGVGTGALMGSDSHVPCASKAGRDEKVAAVFLDAVVRAGFDGPRWDVVVACGGLKGGRADWLVEKTAELGAASLVPLKTARSPTIGADRGDRRGNTKTKESESADTTRGTRTKKRAAAAAAAQTVREDADSDADDLSGRQGRWSRVAASASKQCLRAHALDVASPIVFDALLDRVRATRVALLAAAGAPSLRSVLRNAFSEDDRNAGGVLIVGPEGDFTDEEIADLLDAGAIPVGLGPLRLRVETAAVAIMACVGMMHPTHEPPGC